MAHVDIYFKHGNQAAMKALGDWALEHLRDGATVMIVLNRPDETYTITFTDRELSRADRIRILGEAVDAITSKRDDATHTHWTIGQE